MNSNDRKHFRAHIAAVHDCIQNSDVTATDPNIVMALEELLLAVKIIVFEVESEDFHPSATAIP